MKEWLGINGKSTIFILGTHHLDNPVNGDMFIPNVEGILSDKRQREINNVVDCLKEFRPTKVALEVLKENQNHLNQEYRSFRNGDFPLTTNERHQFGFQLASKMNLEEIFAVDWNYKIEGVPNVGSWAKENNSEIFEEVATKEEQRTKKVENFLQNHTIREYLLWLNDPENIKSTQESYMKLALIGNEENPVGAMWTAQYWYYRNMVIYKNLVELVNSQEERIFLLYGAGHLHLLIQFLQESGFFIVKTASDYLVPSIIGRFNRIRTNGH